ncbi:MAG TPA: DUF6457 domain-containing protein [Actinomycetota bacterium]|nr:DUF6457 domain-containing protein [Actinomycetota bacterium]
MPEDWLTRFGDELAVRLRNGEALAPSGPEKNLLLDLARDVAHSTERKNAPLAAFVVGRYVECRVEQGIDVETAIAEALEAARRILPDQS